MMLVREVAVVGLRRNGQTYKRVTARLVAVAFGRLSPDSKKQIDHRRGIAATRRGIIRGARPHEHSSSFKGVSFIKARRKWYACIRSRGRTRGLGFFNDEATAARAYDRAAFAQWGATAYQNFRRA
jgi:hypothetical protein